MIRKYKKERERGSMFITYIVHFIFCLTAVSCINNYENTDKDTGNKQLLDEIARYSSLDRSDLQAPEEQQTSSTQPIDVRVIVETEKQLQSTSDVITKKSVHFKEQPFEMHPLVHDDRKRYDEYEQQHLGIPDKLADVDAKSTKSEQNDRKLICAKGQDDVQEFRGQQEATRCTKFFSLPSKAECGENIIWGIMAAFMTLLLMVVIVGLNSIICVLKPDSFFCFKKFFSSD
ncbi:hypothetical protein THOM_2714 [Trachipleistophora hominis]|uniref:Uncharacterized protein n=1 Tax=Trachipleistophora hominis TaxID=72359 RepID=L7JTH7_TRAHO|nr:hypothetical protein THOM_2714 [Trachipleistophora hominis]